MTSHSSGFGSGMDKEGIKTEMTAHTCHLHTLVRAHHQDNDGWSLVKPSGIAVAADGSYLVADSLGNTLSRIVRRSHHLRRRKRSRMAVDGMVVAAITEPASVSILPDGSSCAVLHGVLSDDVGLSICTIKRPSSSSSSSSSSKTTSSKTAAYNDPKTTTTATTTYKYAVQRTTFQQPNRQDSKSDMSSSAAAPTRGEWGGLSRSLGPVMRLADPSCVAALPSGSIVVTEFMAGSIVTATPTATTPTAAALHERGACFLAHLSGGNGGGNSGGYGGRYGALGCYGGFGKVSLDDDGAADDARFHLPTGVALDAKGMIVVAESGGTYVG